MIERQKCFTRGYTMTIYTKLQEGRLCPPLFWSHGNANIDSSSYNYQYHVEVGLFKLPDTKNHTRNLEP